jgi:AraC-like DNA-binding protein
MQNTPLPSTHRPHYNQDHLFFLQLSFYHNVGTPAISEHSLNLSMMEVETFYPRHPKLNDHIEYYYFLRTDDKNFSKAYYSFPNTNHSFNIHKNISCKIGADYIHVGEDEQANYQTIIQGKYETPLFIQLKGRLDKVTIIFKPLGVNHFIDRPFTAIAKNTSQLFSEWQNDNAYTDFLNKFYRTTDNTKRAALLETFLLSKYHECSDYALLKKAIEQLTDFETEHSIEEIAKNIGMNTRTFNRIFYKQVGIAPVSFKKIARFRHSLKTKLFDDQFKKLTAIGYESNFYDQSYFIKMYRKLTNETPAAFFKKIGKLADDQLIFKFITD